MEKQCSASYFIKNIRRTLGFTIEDSQFSSSLGIKYPTYRDDPPHTTQQWLDGKRADDGAENLWRIHNKLYDLTDFVIHHPGGAFWLESTKGTDITEAFEVHHLSKHADNLLPKFFIKEASQPRNSPFTFKDGDFYRTLKQRIIEELPKVPKDGVDRSKNYADILAASYIILALASIYCRSLFIGVISGVMLALTCIAAHNFFHRRDNFRMYYFDLSFLGSKEWRISHALSHHLHTNTINDLEISAFEPWFQYLPYKKKGLVVKYLSWIYFPIVYGVLFSAELLKGCFMMISTKNFEKIFLLRFLILLPMTLVSGSFIQSILFFLWIQTMSSLYFSIVGVNAAHHHPDIFHDGDAVRPKEEMDWGIYQLDAVMDRKDITGSHFMVLTNFGDHALHHLFPTLDHGLLEYLYPAFLEVCETFGVEWKLSSQLELVKGQFMQLAKVKPKKEPPKALKKKL